MMREYIFCSVIESPQMANRSPFFKTSPAGLGAGNGWNFSKAASGGFGWMVCPLAREQINREKLNTKFKRIVWHRIVGSRPCGVKRVVSKRERPVECWQSERHAW